MGNKKRRIKIKSGTKMVRVALKKQAALHQIQMATIIASCRCAIGVIRAQKMKTNGRTNEEILGVINDECIVPAIELQEKLKTQSAINGGVIIKNQIGPSFVDELRQKLRRYQLD